MALAPWDEDWLGELSRTYSVDSALLRRLGDEFLAVFDETVEQYVAREHRKAQAAGLSNDEIWTMLREKIPLRRFRALVPSSRQLRRMIYG